MWDIFISHASEDKEAVVRPLVRELEGLGLAVWYDEFALTIGDSLRRKIDYGLSKSRFGVVVLSHNFFSKEWPQRELDALEARETSGEKIILPVWHQITRDEVAKYSPLLADRLAAQTLRGIRAVAQEVVRACRFDRPVTQAHADNDELPSIVEDMRHNGVWHHPDSSTAKGTTWAAIASEAGYLNYNYEFVVYFLKLKNGHNGWYVQQHAHNYCPTPIPSLSDFIEILEVRKEHLELVLKTGDLKTGWDWPRSWGRVPWWGPVVHVYRDDQVPNQRYFEETKVELKRTMIAIEQNGVLLSARSHLNG